MTRAPRLVAVCEAMAEMAPATAEGTCKTGFAGDTLNTAWHIRRSLPALAEWQERRAVCMRKQGGAAPLLPSRAIHPPGYF